MKIIELNLDEFSRVKDLIEQIELFVDSEFTEDAHVGTKEDKIEYKEGVEYKKGTVKITLNKDGKVVENEN